jgi:hypothetical protein
VSILPGIYASQITGHLSTNSYESIQTVTVGSGGSSSIDFTSIPSTYKHLQVRFMSKSATANNYYIRLNGITTASYATHQLAGNGSTVSTNYASNYSLIFGGNNAGNTTYPLSGIIDILDYTDTNKYKTVRVLAGQDLNGSGQIQFNSGFLTTTTAAITAIRLDGVTFDQYSSFALYGIKG